jgi:putative ABC transport system substrate-binding protein
MRRARLTALATLTLALLAAPLGASAQPAGKVPRIGFLTQRSGPGAREEAFRQGLRDLGYVPERDIVIEYKYAAGRLDRERELAAELVRLKVAVIVTGGPTSTRSAKEATNTIPIVMAQDSDPVGNGFVASLARPGGNATGLSNLTVETSGKRLELLKEIVPRLSRVAVIETSSDKGNARELRATELAAASLGLRLQYLDVLDPRDMETALQAARQGQADAVLTQSSPVVLRHPAQYASLAAKSRLPVMLPSRELVEAGGLMSYGASVPDLFRRAAVYVDKILKGAKPADLPIEQPTKFEFIINLKAAKQIGLTIPPSVLARADEIIQ